jgi:hypothetical protein
MHYLCILSKNSQLLSQPVTEAVERSQSPAVDNLKLLTNNLLTVGVHCSCYAAIVGDFSTKPKLWGKAT